MAEPTLMRPWSHQEARKFDRCILRAMLMRYRKRASLNKICDYVSIWELLPKLNPHAMYGLERTGKSRSSYRILSVPEIRQKYKEDWAYARKPENKDTTRAKEFLALDFMCIENCIAQAYMGDRLANILLVLMTSQPIIARRLPLTSVRVQRHLKMQERETERTERTTGENTSSNTANRGGW